MRIFRASLRLLPRWLREEAAGGMEEIFVERVRGAGGPAGAVFAGLRELAGVVATAVRARLPAHRREGTMGWRHLTIDVRHALRRFRRRPLVAVLGAGTLGLGIAASTAIYSVVQAVLLAPPAWGESDRVVALYPTNPELEGHPTLGEAAVRGTFSVPEVQALRRTGGDVLLEAAVLAPARAILVRDDGPAEALATMRTDAALFSGVLDVQPARGRSFTADEQRRGDAVAVIADGFWQREFGGDPAVIGRRLTLGATTYQVVGVLPEGFEVYGEAPDLWIPIGPDEEWGRHSYKAVGRLAPGVDRVDAEAILTTGFRSVAPPNHAGHAIRLFQLRAEETRAARRPLALLSVAALVLLLVACGNVAVLLIGAALDREEELAVRGALGAGRGRIFGQLLTESVVLAALGAALGLALTQGVIAGLEALAPAGMRSLDAVRVDGRVLLTGIGLALACGAVFGLAPAWLFSDRSLAGAMGTRGARRRRGGLQSAAVVGELALATVLVAGAGLLGRTLMEMSRVDPGFDLDRLAYARFSVSGGRIAPGVSGEERGEAVRQLYEAAREAVASVPGVESVSLVSTVPLSGMMGNNDIASPQSPAESVVASRRFVSADFFETTGIRIVEGRGFDAFDDRPESAPVMVVSQGVSDALFPDGGAVGKTVRYWGRDTEVVGVAESIADVDLTVPTSLSYYVPRTRAGETAGDLLIRLDPAADGVLAEVRSRIQGVSNDIAIRAVAPVTAFVDAQLADERYRVRLVAIFSGLAALFAVLGIYGVTARTVAARTREMGIRRALGASGGRVTGLVLRQAFRLSFFGAVFGIVATFLFGRLLEGFLWGVTPHDPPTLIGTGLVLGIASVLAALVPGRRAARADPVEALRGE